VSDLDLDRTLARFPGGMTPTGRVAGLPALVDLDGGVHAPEGGICVHGPEDIRGPADVARLLGCVDGSTLLTLVDIHF
jgi:hypothetical protein